MPKISQARKDERREQILSAAALCFARQGFQRTTILDICAEAGLSTGAVYSYFESKDAIIAALRTHGRDATAEHVTTAQRASRPIERLQALFSPLKRADGATVFQMDVRSWAEAIGDEAMRDIARVSRTRLVSMIAGLAEPLAAAKGVAPVALAELITSVIVGCEVQKAIWPDADVRPLLDALTTLLDARPGAAA
jgi:AcrR family transcriptional regulator